GAGGVYGLTDQKGIMALHGSIENITVAGVTVPAVFSIHPAFVLRDPTRVDDFADAVEKAVALATGEDPRGEKMPVDYRLITSPADLATLTAEMEDTGVLSWDIETAGKRAFAEGAAVSCVAFSTRPGTG